MYVGCAQMLETDLPGKQKMQFLTYLVLPPPLPAAAAAARPCVGPALRLLTAGCAFLRAPSAPPPFAHPQLCSRGPADAGDCRMCAHVSKGMVDGGAGRKEYGSDGLHQEDTRQL